MTREEAISYLMHIDTCRKLLVSNIKAIGRMRKPNENDRQSRCKYEAALHSMTWLHHEIGTEHQVGGY